MLKKINRFIAQSGIWIFILAALYKFTFWIINMVTGFQAGGGPGVSAMFLGLFNMLFDLVILAVLLEVSRKIAEKYTAADFAPPVYNNAPGYPAPMQGAPMQGAPVQNVAPNVQSAPASGTWFCNACGTQNGGDSAFCIKCGKPK